MLGVSHDAGYAPFLDEILRDEASRRRITILEGTPAVRDLAKSGLNVLNLNAELFRAEKLVDKALRDPAHLVTTSPVSVVAGMSPLPPPPGTPINGNTNGAASYANAAIKSASPPPQVTLPFQPKSVKASASASKRDKPSPWNPGPRGLDPPLTVNQAALENIKKRKDSNKLCNNHYLRGPCAKGDACCFEHKYRPNESEKTAIAFLARLNPCTNGQDCEVEDCIYGHHVSLRSYHTQSCSCDID